MSTRWTDSTAYDNFTAGGTVTFSTTTDSASTIWQGGWATMPMAYTAYGTGFQITDEMLDDDLKSRREEEDKVNVYIIALIDTIEAEVLRWEVTLGKTDAEATAALELTKDQSKLVTKGDYAIIFSRIGSYEAPKITRTKKMD